MDSPKTRGINVNTQPPESHGVYKLDHGKVKLYPFIRGIAMSFFTLFSLPKCVVKYHWGYDHNGHLQIELLDDQDVFQGWITHLSGDKFLYQRDVIKVGWENGGEPHPWESSEFLAPSGEGVIP